VSPTIHRFVTGDYVSPAGSRVPGQRVVAVAYLVRHPDAMLLFDTGFPFDGEVAVSEGDAELRTFPRSLAEALRRLGASVADLDLVVNCHLHIDHAGGNFRLRRDTPIYAQAAELAGARAETDELVVDALALDRQAYRSIEGESEILPGTNAQAVLKDGPRKAVAVVAVPVGVWRLGPVVAERHVARTIRR
jgi:glyoxylase-like metal-dependent hydrolase (beta-lactamase superfamily II)